MHGFKILVPTDLRCALRLLSVGAVARSWDAELFDVSVMAGVSTWKNTFGGSLGEKHNLVVCDMWREIRLEATEQAFGRTIR